VASSADGSHLLAGGNSALYTSTNAGANWTTNNVPVRDWACVASSADGNQLAAAVGYPNTGGIYVSTNGGGIWTPSAAPANQWHALAMSPDGTKLMALPATGAPLYMSTDSGTSWQTNNLSANFLMAVAASADGNQWAVVEGGGGVFVSTNIGISWASNNVNSWPFDAPCLAASADGHILVAAQGGNGGSICISTNLGASWNTNTVRKVWGSVAASADGRRLIAGSYPAIYTSTDFGMTWISNTAPSMTWRAVASSADGSKLVAATWPGGIYTWQAAPAPAMNIVTESGRLKLSWLVPSTNFVTQESPDLQSWANLTNQPILNLTNLQNEILLSTFESTSFYRLVEVP
jgi:hypothetical protein